MRDNLYLIPANSKKGQLIFNLFRGIDLAIFALGIGLSIIFFIVLQDFNDLFSSLLKILPACLGGFLVVPVPNYHNVMEFIKDMFKFFLNRRVYKWKGWCAKGEYSEEK